MADDGDLLDNQATAAGARCEALSAIVDQDVAPMISARGRRP